jgi:hypothetical protein
MDSNLQNKLQEFSAPPPEGTWSKIADALNAGDSFSQRLYHYEETPPVAVWQTVEQALTDAVPAKVVPFTARFRRPLRYAAVAGFLAVILVTITLTVKRTEAGALEADSNTTVPTSKQTTIPIIVSENSGNMQRGKPEESIVTTAPLPLDTQNAPLQKGGKETTASVDTRNNIPKAAGPAYASVANYIYFDDGDGRMRKVSKKLAGFVKCKDNDLKCQQRLRELRQRMAANAMTTDFTGILEMLRQLK